MEIITRQIASVILCFSTLLAAFLRADIVPAGAESLVDVLRREFADVESETRYFDAYFDLNSDGNKEAIVYVYGPEVCGTGGCDTLIFTQDRTGYKLISRIAISRPPIMVLAKAANGWRSLAVFVVGGGIQPGYFAELQFDGKTYPENPSVKPARPLKSKPVGSVVIQKFSSFSEGKILKGQPGAI